MATVAHLGNSGIVLGEVDAEGIDWSWHAGEDPWGPSPAPREQAGDRANGHGQWDDTRYYGPRTVPHSGQAEGDHEALHRARERLRAAVSAAPFTLRIVEPGMDRQATVRRGGDVLWTEEHVDVTGHARAVWSFAVHQPDPLIYGTTLRTLDPMPLPSTSGGLTAPFAAPFAVAATVTAGLGTVVNAGTEEAAGVLTLTGPLQDAVITQPDTGRLMRLENPDGALLGAADTLVIDAYRRRVLLGGVTSRRSWMRGDWITFPPGASELRWDSSVFTAATLSATWHDTWI